jgi:hypothetical protein
VADKSKDVIYIDVDDEITGVIDKVRSSDGRVLALVLPKRASVFQSIVNMKLLKRAADEDKKRLVLITSEAGLLPLAGAVKIHVARTLQSKPEIPAAPDVSDTEESVDEDEPLAGPQEVTAETAGNRPIGELAGPAAAVPPLTTDDAMETVELDNDTEEEAASLPVSTAPLPMAAKKDKKLKVPNFNRFRLLLALGALGLIIIIALLFVAVTVLPKATIAIKTNATNVNTNLSLTLDTTALALDETANVVPAKQVQEQKSFTQTASATGQANKGDRASGTVSMTAQACAPNIGTPDDVPAGTGVSYNGLTYITQSDASFSFSNASGSCVNYVSDGVDIIAQGAGAKYNADNVSFAVAGRSDVKATGSASGGTDNIVKVISQADIDGAKGKISAQDGGAKHDLQSQLAQDGYYAVMATFNAGTPSVTTSANAGDTADSVTVTEAITYTLIGAHKSDLTTLIDNQIKGQIDTSKQSILDDGLARADIKVINSTAKTTQLGLQATGVVGPDIKVDAVKQLAAGKKSGDVKSALKSQPGITDVTVKLSPFWVSSVPKNQNKITVTIAKPTGTIKADANNP